MLAVVCLLVAAGVADVIGAPRSLEDGAKCEVRARLPNGWVCGVRRLANNETHFASFLGVPYAAQPVGERRFKELEPVEPWDDFYDASAEGPACPQHDVFYGSLLGSGNMSEACIYANIHVPIQALPGYKPSKPAEELQPPHEAGLSEAEENPGLPILVFIHGGGFTMGSGSIALHGPEYLIDKDVIVITFNYRLNVFGFLSLNSSSIPGNNGLRDMVTLLHWVQENARSFGGDPNDVTLAGQSAGAISAHLLSLSKAADGLFQRLYLMSGTGISTFYTTSPVYAEYVAKLLLSSLSINATDPEEIHRQLVAMPLEKIMESNKMIQDQFGLTGFLPVVESTVPKFTTILDNDPEVLVSMGRGDNIPIVMGFTTAECESFRQNFEKFDILSRIKDNPLLMLPINLIYKLPIKIAGELAQKIHERYFDGEPTMDKYIKSCSDMYYVYPALKLAEKRMLMQGAPVYLYEYAFKADFSVIKKSKGLTFKGTGHVEDLTFIFRANAMDNVKGFYPPTDKDAMMADWMTKFVKKYMYCNDPTCKKPSVSGWPPLDEMPIQYQYIDMPMMFRYMELTEEQQSMKQFFDSLQNKTS